jgi:arabinan endo-1,5-alpha-L-arabinosidase
MNEGGQIFLHSNLDPTGRWPVRVTSEFSDDGDFVAYHAYDRQAGGRPTLRIQRIGWGNDGWPVAQ